MERGICGEAIDIEKGYVRQSFMEAIVKMLIFILRTM